MMLYRYLTDPDDAAFFHRVTAALNRGGSLHRAQTGGGVGGSVEGPLPYARCSGTR